MSARFPANTPDQRLTGHVPATSAQADLGRQLHRPLLFWYVTVSWGNREDESSLPEAHPVDQDRVVGIRQDDHIADVDITGQDHILHK